MWLAIIYVYSAWTGALLERYPVNQFDTKEECYEFIKDRGGVNLHYGCFEKDYAPKEYHAD